MKCDVCKQEAEYDDESGHWYCNDCGWWICT